MKATTTILVVHRRRWVRNLTLAVVFFSGMHLVSGLLVRANDHPAWGLVHKWFSLERVGNPPGFFSIFLVLYAAFLFWVLSRADRLPDGDPAQRHRWWRLLAVVFVFLAADEMFRFHDRLDKLPLFGATNGAARQTVWMFMYAGAGMVLALLLVPFWWRLPAGYRWRYFLCAAMYLAGARVLEVVGLWIVDLRGTGSRLFLCVQTAEETLEMGAMVGVIATHLRWIVESRSTLVLKVE